MTAGIRPTRRLALPGAVLSGLVALAISLAPGIVGFGSAASAATVKHATTSATTAPNLSRGKTLFDQNCSSCHGIDAQGGSLAPNLRGLGPATVDLWVSSGWMPLANPTSQPATKPALFDRSDTIAIAEYVASLAPGGLPIPTVDLKGASVSDGFSIFALNCAPCHTITGAGDALSNGLYAPALHGVTAVRVAEAVRSGPGNMPRFGPGQLSKSQLNSLIAYVTRNIEHPVSPGGLGLGGVGPVAEGFIGLFVGVGACLLVALWIGDRTEREDTEADHGGHADDGPEVAHV